MNKIKILNKINKQKIDIDKGYDLLYKKEIKLLKKVSNRNLSKKVTFVKIRLQLKEYMFLTKFIGLLFVIVLQVGVINWFNNQIDNIDLIKQMLVKGIFI